MKLISPVDRVSAKEVVRNRSLVRQLIKHTFGGFGVQERCSYLLNFLAFDLLIIFLLFFQKSTKSMMAIVQGVIYWYPPKKLKYGKPRLGESTLT